MYKPSSKKSSKKIKKMSDQVKLSFTPKNSNIKSYNYLKREKLGYVNNNLTKNRMKILGFTKPIDVLETFKGFWTFDTPDGNEVVDFTFGFTGGLSIDDFGDGTNEANIISGQKITKSYS
mgnify:CR=1 FL=1